MIMGQHTEMERNENIHEECYRNRDDGSTSPTLFYPWKETATMASVLDLTQERHAHIDQRLRNDEVIWLHTTRPDGRPHAVVVWFLWDGETVLMFSRPKNQKVSNIQHNQNVLLALDNTDNGSDPITLEGTATLLTHDEVGAILANYTQKYGEGIKGLGMTPEQMVAAYSQAIRITPTRVM